MEPEQIATSTLNDVVHEIKTSSRMLESNEDEDKEAIEAQCITLLAKARRLVFTLETPFKSVLWMA